MDLLDVVTIEEACGLLESHFGEYEIDSELVPLERAPGRYLAEDILSPEAVPAFRRSTKDGYAVRSRDVSGAAETLPAFLVLKGEVFMGEAAGMETGPGEAVYVPTGAMVPEGADAIVMIEYTEPLTEDEIAVYRPVSLKENIISEGDDLAKGSLALPRGRKLHPADIGVLASIGLLEVPVFRKPAVAVISTGDEIIPPGESPAPGQVRDINSWTVSAAAASLGFEVSEIHTAGDDRAELERLVASCRERNDITLISGGSSVGKKDYSVAAIEAAGLPGIFCHGLAFKPGKPTIIADAGGKPVIGLPGHPVSALMVLGILGRKLMSLMMRSKLPAEGRISAVLTENLAGAPGREAWQTVRLTPVESGFEARPIHGESGLISVLADSDGIVRIPQNSEGAAAGSTVDVYLINS